MRTFFLLLTLFLLAILLRLVLALAVYGNYDMESYQIVVAIARTGGNVYSLTFRYNYSPVWFHILAELDRIRGAIPLYSAVRGLISWIDLLNAALIGLIADCLFPGRGRIASVAYALNPAAIFISGYHGQFEALALVPILIGVYAHLRWNWGFWKLLACCVAAVIIKQNALFIVWLLLAAWFGYRRAMLGCLVAVLGFLLTLAPYMDGGNLLSVLLYSGGDPQFGLSALFPTTLTLILMGIGLFVTPYLFRRQLWYVTVIAGILIWFVTGGYAMQYTTYLLIFVGLQPQFSRRLMMLSAFVALAEAARIDAWNGILVMNLILVMLFLWAGFALWWIDLLRSRRSFYRKNILSTSNNRSISITT